jgi:hexokinase
MQNTFVPSLPDGSEHGDYLSLDLGSTNFRVLLTRLRPNLDKKEECLVKFYDVPESLRVGSAIKVGKTYFQQFESFLMNEKDVIKIFFFSSSAI